MDLNKKIFTENIAGRPLRIEISRVAEQANAAIMATYGETTVLVTAVMSDKDKEVNFMPLTVDYEEKFYAAGKIFGSRFIRREGRPSEEAIISGRLVDRAIRPFFDKRLRRDIQITVTVLSFDEENDPDFIALNAASIALGVSDIPWNGPVAGVRIAKIGKRTIINPTYPELNQPDFSFSSFIAAGQEQKINMIELEAREVDEAEVVAAYKTALGEIDKLIAFQQKIIQAVGRPKAAVKLVEPSEDLRKNTLGFLQDKLEPAIYVPQKTERQENLAQVKNDLLSFLASQGFSSRDDIWAAEMVFEEEINRLVHEQILRFERRPDGRRLDEIRDLHIEVGLLPRTHGSALFIRGNTQALAVVTLAPPGSEQLIETIEYSGKRRFMLHYNFPPYSVGETGSFRGPGRRDIGHGALAEKALRPLIPNEDQFPYTIRVVSEILSSNGSSSMATVCAASLALMDAGVPLRKPAAGIALGLISGEEGQYKILTDIQGPEDHYGDMDFKAAGTADGLNAVQMDVKIEGVELAVIQELLGRAKKARLEILGAMNRVIDKPRPEISIHAPKVVFIDINPSRIGEVIGPGGKIINGIIERTGVTTIDIEQNGRVFVAAKDRALAEKAIEEIQKITKEYEVGEIVEGKVSKILDFGAIVDLGGGRDGMIHISELKKDFVKDVHEVVKVGERVRVKVIRVEPDGRLALSLKQLSTE